jgi:hypothetical protein
VVVIVVEEPAEDCNRRRRAEERSDDHEPRRLQEPQATKPAVVEAAQTLLVGVSRPRPAGSAYVPLSTYHRTYRSKV